MYWETAVAFCVVITAAVAPAGLSIVVWPLLKVPCADRARVWHRLVALPSQDRRRMLYSRRLDRLAHEE